jgi:manganese/iron transport system permease protein
MMGIFGHGRATIRSAAWLLAVLAVLAVLLGGLGGGVGLAASYEASIHHGVRLASGATVVLTLVAFHLLGLAAVGVGRLAGRRRRHRPPAEAADLAEVARTRLPGGSR